MSLEELNEIVGDANIVDKIMDRYKSSMGNDLPEVDEQSIKSFAAYIIRHFDYKKELQGYLKDQMENIAPNLTALLGESIGARLLTHAGGLNNLSKLPASTIQILGAEKALFRALKNRGNTPKYGLLFNSSFISRADLKSKGKVSRMLANKCALSSRLDNFLIEPTDKFGSLFKEQLDTKIENPNDSDIGKKNIATMELLVEKMTKKGEYKGAKKIKTIKKVK